MSHLAPPAPPFRGKPLPASPRPTKRQERDIVSRIIGTYGGDPGIVFSPTDPVPIFRKPLPEPAAEIAQKAASAQMANTAAKPEKTLKQLRDEEKATTLAPVMMGDYDPFQQASPLGTHESKTERDLLLNKWRSPATTPVTTPAPNTNLGKRRPSETTQKQAPAAQPRQRKDSAHSKESSLETPLPILPSTTYGQTNTPASPEKKVSTSPRGFRRSSKPTSLTLRKSNGLTQDSHTLSKQIRAAEVPVKLESTASPFQSSSRSRSDVDKFSQPSELRKASFSTIVREKKLPAPPPGLQTVGAFEALATAPAPVFGNAQKGWALREPASASAQTSQTAKSLPTLSTLAARLRDEGDEDDEDPFDDIIDELISERFEDEDLANSPPSSPEDMKNVVMNIFGKRKPSATPKTDVPAPPPSPPQHDRAARKESNAGNQLTKVVSPQNYPPTPPTLPATPTDLEPIDLDSKRLDEMMQGDSEITIMASPTAVINAGDNGLAQMHAAFAAYKSQVEGPQQLQTLETLKPSVYTPTGSSISGPVKQPTPPSPASSYASAHASISSLINPQPGDGYVSPVKNSQLRCHGDHRQWWGPKRNGGRGACQLCFTTGAPAPTPADAAADDDTAAKPEFFQCVLCALWVCTPCHKAVELAMGRTGRPRLAPPSPLPPRGMLTPSRPVGPPGFARSPMSERPPPRRSPLGPSPTPGYGPGGMGRPPGSSSGPPPPRSSSKRPPGSSSGPPPPSSASGSSPGSSSGPTPAASSGPPPAPSAGSNPAPIKPSLSVRLGLAGQHAVRGQPPPVPAPAST